MKKLLIIILFACSLQNSFATNYYWSSTGNDSNTGTSAAQAWQTSTKVSAHVYSPGDAIFIKRGDTLSGVLTISQSGNSSNHILISTYGNGTDPNPVFTGFSTASGWISDGGGIYHISNSYNTTIVTVDGKIRLFGRYPNSTSYLYCTGFSGTSITTTSLPVDFTGSEVVMQRANWIVDRFIVSSQSGSTLNYTNTPVVGAVDTYTPRSTSGGSWLFLQNSVACLDTTFEWCQVSGNLSMYFGGNSPTSYSVKYSTQDYNINLQANDYIDIYNIDLEGASIAGINSTSGATNITINGVHSDKQGAYFIKGYLPNSTIDGCVSNNSLAGGIRSNSSSNNITITNCQIDSSGMAPGNLYSGDGQGCAGISLVGDNQLVQYNSVNGTGYMGIDIRGNWNKVYNNEIQNWGNVKSDCGGIYNSNSSNIGNDIRYNIVHDGVNPFWATTPGPSNGIYCDNGARDGSVVGNTAFNIIGAAIYNQYDAYRWFIDSNTCYNFAYGLRLNGRTQDSSHWNVSTHNIFTTLSSTSPNMVIVYGNRASQRDSAFQRLDSNYYISINNASIRTDSLSFFLYYLTLPQWQTLEGKDLHSIAPYIPSVDSVRIEYNATKSEVAKSLPYKYKDVYGNIYNGSITLQPYSSAILIYDSNLPPQLPFVKVHTKITFINLN